MNAVPRFQSAADYQAPAVLPHAVQTDSTPKAWHQHSACTYRRTGVATEVGFAGGAVARIRLVAVTVGVGWALHAGALLQPPAIGARRAHAAGASAAVCGADTQSLPVAASCALAVVGWASGKEALLAH